MTQEFKQGDRVQWNSGSGQATGKIKQKITNTKEVAGKKIKATEDSPRYLVENENTQTITGHKAATLSPVDKNNQNDLTEKQQQIFQDFQEAVNMTSQELQQWLPTEESKSVGQKDGDGEAIGHKSGKKIIEILESNNCEYTESDFNHMKKVTSYVHRHLAQKPSGDIKETPWRYSLMNWGHDPLK